MKKLSRDVIIGLVAMADCSGFESTQALVNTMIDFKKNIFFGENETDKDKLFVDHAYARGEVAGMLSILRLCMAAKQELRVREGKEK